MPKVTIEFDLPDDATITGIKFEEFDGTGMTGSVQTIFKVIESAVLAWQWQPIETAPKDGTNVLLVNHKVNIANGFWLNGIAGTGWFLRGGNKADVFFNDHHGPTYWIPLPPTPAAQEE